MDLALQVNQMLQSLEKNMGRYMLAYFINILQAKISFRLQQKLLCKMS